MNESAKKLFDCFMDIEESQYPANRLPALRKRRKIVEKLIDEFGRDHVVVTNHTNMMLPSSWIGLDVYHEDGWKSGTLDIGLGSEPKEVWASRKIYNPGVTDNWEYQKFDFESWTWL